MHTKLTRVLCASLLAWVMPTVSGSNHGPFLNRHAELAKRAEGDVQLFNRGAESHWTYYNVETGNAGSCGVKHANTDFTVAMNAAQMNPAWCFKTITMTTGGKTTTATISDTCPGCPYGGLDLTEGLFAFFLGHWPEGGGVFTGDWEFTDAAPAKPVAPPPPPPPPPVTTTKPPPPPPVTSTKPPPVVSSTHSSSTKISSTSTKASITSISTTSKTSNTSASSTSVSSSASISIDYLSGAASGLAIPTGSIDTTGSPSNLAVLNSILIQLGGLAMAANN